MTHPLRFHMLMLPNVAWVEFKARIVRLEQLGLEVVALADHFVDWTNPVVSWFETWTSLAALAEATSTIRLTTCVTQIPLRNPAMLARQVLTLDHISNGRIEVGLGTGLTIDPSYAMAGLPNWDAKERVERFGEYIELVSQLLSQEVTTYSGRYYQVDRSVMNPRPVQSPRPPIMVAALAPRMMRHATRHADIWNSLSFLSSFDEQIDETRVRCEAIDAHCLAVDREPASLRRSYTMYDAQQRHNGGSISYYESTERFVDCVNRVAQLGVSDVGLYYPSDPAQVAIFEEIATTTLPALRAHYPAV